MKIFSNHRKKVEPHRRFGSREFKDKLNTAKNYKRLGQSAQKGFTTFFSKTGLSQIGTLIAIVGLGVIFYFLVLSPYFRITQIAVSGNKQVPTEEITGQIASLAQKRYLLVPRNSFFTLNQSRVAALFAANIPEIATIQIHRSWPNKISIQVTERNPAVVLIDNNKNYLVDDQGFVIKEIVDPGTEFQILDQVNEPIQTGESITGKIIPFVISLEKQWPSKISAPLVSAKIPGKGAAEAEFVSSEGWSVFLSTDRSVANQLHSLTLIMNQAVSSKDRGNLAYIDLRLSDRAYLCMKSTPCQQTDVPATASSTLEPQTVTPQVTTQP